MSDNNLPKNTLGSFVWWDMQNTSIRPQALRDLLTRCDYDIGVPEIDPASAIKRAAAKWGQGRGKQDRYKAEVVYSDRSEVVVGILRREHRASKEVGWDQVETLTFDTESSTWTVEDTDSGVKDQISMMAESFIGQANDFRLFLDVYFIRPEVIAPELESMNRISLRGQGGVYFVPGIHLERLRKLKTFVDQVGNSNLNLAHVGTDGDSVQSILSAVSDHVITGLQEVEKELTKWEESSRKTRTDSSARILGELVGLKDLADLYEGALSTSLQELRNEVDDHRRRALGILASEERAA